MVGRTRRLCAANTAAHLTGSIHDDEVARQLGYRAGIVSGVVLYAHRTYVAAGRENRLFQGTASIPVASDLLLLLDRHAVIHRRREGPWRPLAAGAA